MTITRIKTSDADTAPPFKAESFWKQFRNGVATTGGVRLHYVEGGSGPVVLLLPGWPQSWYAWRYMMPLLVEDGHHVIALDPRGMGDSGRPSASYDVGSVAREIHFFLEGLNLLNDGPIDVVGHDVGAWLAYALTADHPESVRRLAVFDGALPGITPPPPAGIPSDEANIKTWHFAFNRLPDLPEMLIQGREREFLDWLFRMKSVRSWTIGPTDLDEYVRVNTAPGSARAAFGYYRHVASEEGLAASRSRSERKIILPVLALGAEHGVGEALPKTMELVATNVRGGVLQNCGHYMPEEAPRTLVKQLSEFWNTDSH